MPCTRQASGSAGDGGKGSICALARNATGPSDCGNLLWCREAEVPPLHGSGYGWCTDEPRPAQTLLASATTLAQVCILSQRLCVLSSLHALNICPLRTVPLRASAIAWGSKSSIVLHGLWSGSG